MPGRPTRPHDGDIVCARPGIAQTHPTRLKKHQPDAGVENDKPVVAVRNKMDACACIAAGTMLPRPGSVRLQL